MRRSDSAEGIGLIGTHVGMIDWDAIRLRWDADGSKRDERGDNPDRRNRNGYRTRCAARWACHHAMLAEIERTKARVPNSPAAAICLPESVRA
jgi:hypothetical protein